MKIVFVEYIIFIINPLLHVYYQNLLTNMVKKVQPLEQSMYILLTKQICYTQSAAKHCTIATKWL
jgi:hypothetical protein